MRNRNKPKDKRESRRKVGMVLDKTTIYVTTDQLTMCDNRRKCQSWQTVARFWTPPDAINVPSDRSQLRSCTGHMNVFYTILSRPPVTAEVRVWSRSRQCGICIGQSGFDVGLLLLLRISPVSITPPTPDWHPFISHPRYITLPTDSVNE